MRPHQRVQLPHDVYLNGAGRLPAGTAVEVVKLNQRYIYVNADRFPGSLIRLTRRDFDTPKA